MSESLFFQNNNGHFPVLISIRMRPPSPSMKLLSGSNDAKSAINLVISQVASNDVTSSIQALAQVSSLCAFFFQNLYFVTIELLLLISRLYQFQCVFHFQIDDVLKDTNKAELFAEHVDQFLVVCTLQLRMAYSKHMGDDDVDKDSIIRLYKCLLATTLSVRFFRHISSQNDPLLLPSYKYGDRDVQNISLPARSEGN